MRGRRRVWLGPGPHGCCTSGRSPITVLGVRDFRDTRMIEGPRNSRRQQRLRVGGPGADEAEKVYEWRDEHRRALPVEELGFDRIGFARRVIDKLRPARCAVMIRHGHRVLRIERGERWTHPGQTWATVAIPGDASRAEIVLALLDLVGARNDPYWIDLLLGLPPAD